MKLEILGTTYDISEQAEANDPLLNTVNGYCDSSIKKIVISELKQEQDSKKDLEAVKKSIKRHEIIHAFFYESGLDTSS